MPRTNLTNPYVLLTPGPLSTSSGVRKAMLRDWCTWDADYNSLVQDIRQRLVALASPDPNLLTAVLMQGSGTFAVESVVGSLIPEQGKLLVLANGAYGQRMAQIARTLRIPCEVHDSGELLPPDAQRLREALASDASITHVGLVHCETTTGMLNPLEDLASIVKEAGRTLIVDAMSSFGGIPMDVTGLGIDVLVSSANKCIQGVPGIALIIARRELLERCRGQARSLSLDLVDQWDTMEQQGGKWRYTSPTHVVHAFHQALIELDQEGGVEARHWRYCSNQAILVKGMAALGFEALLPVAFQSPIITAFRYPQVPQQLTGAFSFGRFYHALKERGFVIYPGKVSQAETFRIGNIGAVTPATMRRLLAAVRQVSHD